MSGVVGGLVVGIDIGNATTEVVLARESGGVLAPVLARQAPTRGVKGSATSVTAAAALVRRMVETVGERPVQGAVAPLTPVHTGVLTGESPGAATGRLVVVPVQGRTLVRAGVAVGRPVTLEALGGAAGGEPIVVVVPSGVGYAETARAVNATDADVVAVVLADDEAVLVGNRLERRVPVVDQAPVDRLFAASAVAAEVAGAGGVLTHLTDPLWLAARLRLDDREREDAVAAAAQLTGRSAGLVLLAEADAKAQPADADPAYDGSARNRRHFAPGRHPHDAADVVVLDVTATVWPREPGPHRLATAYLAGADAMVDPAPELTALLGFPVVLAASEPAMSVLGAASTPGVSVSPETAVPETAVLDLGAGTADLIVGDRVETRAGCGALLTLAVAEALGATKGAAEWIKRGPSVRVEGPTLRVTETGERYLDDIAAPASAIGRLAVPGPAGLLGFGGELPAATWRSARWALKEAVLGRALRETALALPPTLVVLGGPAGDDEAITAVSALVPAGTVVGRANVAGSLGHRYAVAWGLALTARASAVS